MSHRPLPGLAEQTPAFDPVIRTCEMLRDHFADLGIPAVVRNRRVEFVTLTAQVRSELARARCPVTTPANRDGCAGAWQYPEYPRRIFSKRPDGEPMSTKIERLRIAVEEIHGLDPSATRWFVEKLETALLVRFEGPLVRWQGTEMDRYNPVRHGLAFGRPTDGSRDDEIELLLTEALLQCAIRESEERRVDMARPLRLPLLGRALDGRPVDPSFSGG